MKHALIFAGLVFIGLSCSQPAKENKEEVSYDSYGAQITPDDLSDLTTLTSVGESDTLSLKIQATVDDVCQMKGCWMTLKNGDGEPIRVTFKDYGFFVPKDISGKDVIVSGIVSKVVLAPDVAEHYAEDAGEEYDSTKTYVEYAFLADGVLIKN